MAELTLPCPNCLDEFPVRLRVGELVGYLLPISVPEGHVTGVPGLVDSPRKSERNAMLSLLGDGVVPAQGAAAFSFLLAHLAQRLAAGVAA